MSRVLITGIDGVTFDTLDPWMDDGVLPYLASIRREGVTAPLRSTFPPITAPAWVSFMTGKNPGKTGIFEFLYSRGGTFEQTPVNATVRDGIPLWEILSREGRRVLVLGVPVTYPPDPVRGTLISGFLTPPGARDFTRPPELLDELEEAFGPYPIYHKEVYQKGKVDRVLDEAFRILEYRRNVSLKLLKEREWDFAITYFEGTDRVQHELWHVFDETHPHSNRKESRAHRDRVLDYYREVDETARLVGEAARGFDPDATEIIMSDHGFGPIHTYMNFNVWLWENGFLRLRRDLSTRLKTLLFRLGFTPALGYRAAMRFGLAGLRLSRGVGARSVLFDRINRIFLSLENIDWEKTRAFSKGNYGQIYVNLRGRERFGSVDPADYDRTAGELVDKLREIRDPEDGGPLLAEVFRREERYEGPYVERMPDVLFIPRDMKHKALGIVDFTTRRFLEPTFGNSGDHRMDGVFFARGGPFLGGAGRIETLSIADVTPTVLHVFGLGVPEDMDGRVIEAALRPDWLRENPVRFRPPYERARPEELDLDDAERREIIDRLKGMGYVG
ncbi:MAG: alkaline phosphatase family protein [Candidatus Eisenbacteria bacterium]|nr:alkaline phosphatase family protein [Candidatus Eisenbacteria bacterium]